MVVHKITFCFMACAYIATPARGILCSRQGSAIHLTNDFCLYVFSHFLDSKYMIYFTCYCNPHVFLKHLTCRVEFFFLFCCFTNFYLPLLETHSFITPPPPSNTRAKSIGHSAV